MYFIGQGIDIHKLKKQKKSKVTLGGIGFLSDYCIIAHSDGDIIYHSLSDAILGAIGLGDIGEYFSDKDRKNKNLNSMKILNFCFNRLRNKKLKIVNIDITIICEKIMLSNIKNQIIQNLKKITRCKNINIKATRYEKNTNFIECHTIALFSN